MPKTQKEECSHKLNLMNGWDSNGLWIELTCSKCKSTWSDPVRAIGFLLDILSKEREKVRKEIVGLVEDKWSCGCGHCLADLKKKLEDK